MSDTTPTTTTTPTTPQVDDVREDNDEDLSYEQPENRQFALDYKFDTPEGKQQARVVVYADGLRSALAALARSGTEELLYEVYKIYADEANAEVTPDQGA